MDHFDNYEVNVLTRKGGWKKLPQEVKTKDTQTKIPSSNISDNLNINVTDESFENINEETENNLFENFTEINAIINKLKEVENQKYSLLQELDTLKKKFETRKDSLDKKLTNIHKEKEMYEKAINLIFSLKKV